MTQPTLSKTHRWPVDLFEQVEAIAAAEGLKVQPLLNELLRIGLEHRNKEGSP